MNTTVAAAIVVLGVVALLMVAVFAALALTDADAQQGPPPTRRPLPFAHELDSGLGAYADASYATEWDAEIARTPGLEPPLDVVDMSDLDEAETVEDVVRGWAR